MRNRSNLHFESMVGAWFPTSKKRKQNVGCLLGQSGKVWNWKEATRSFLGRAWKKQVWKKEECRRTNWRRFDRIFNDTPVSPPPLVFRSVDSRRRNPEAENSPRFRGRIPRPASRGLSGATRLIGSNDGAGSRPAAHRNRHFSDSIGRHRAKSNCGRESMRRLQ